MADVKQPESVQQAVERLREAEADRVRRGFIYLSCEPEVVATVIAALEAAELKIAAAPQVQCDIGLLFSLWLIAIGAAGCKKVTDPATNPLPDSSATASLVPRHGKLTGDNAK